MRQQGSYRMMIVWLGVMAGLLAAGGTTKGDFTFGTPVNLGPVFNSPYDEGVDCFSADGLEMYVTSNRPGTYGGWDIWVSRRETLDDDWGTLEHLGSPVNTAQPDASASISADGLELYFCAYNRPAGYGNFDIWVAKRQSRQAEWQAPANLGSTVNSSAYEADPSISFNGLELYFGSNRAGGYGSHDIWVSTRATRNDPWGQPVNLGPVVNSPASEGLPGLSSDGLILFFSEEINSPIRPGGFGNLDMWMARRASLSAAWGTPVNLGPIVNTASMDSFARISPDASALYFGSGRPGGFGGTYGWGDIWQARIIPVVDFNADGRVEIGDLVVLIESWGKAEPRCDIGPTPLGDGTVDAADLEVLMGHWNQEVDDPTLVGHWALDETAGIVAQDHAGTNNGTIMGLPQWRPQGGRIAGAMEFNGTTFVTTKSVLSPAAGCFSVLAWVKGGAPGQTVIAQGGGANWLMADAATGGLRTELRNAARNSVELSSEVIITDGHWHRIAFTWDGTHRRLYVDGVLMAEDAQDSLAASSGNLIIGAGKGLEPSTFWKGLIDDVRIYNRAVQP